MVGNGTVPRNRPNGRVGEPESGRTPRRARRRSKAPKPLPRHPPAPTLEECRIRVGRRERCMRIPRVALIERKRQRGSKQQPFRRGLDDQVAAGFQGERTTDVDRDGEPAAEVQPDRRAQGANGLRAENDRRRAAALFGRRGAARCAPWADAGDAGIARESQQRSVSASESAAIHPASVSAPSRPPPSSHWTITQSSGPSRQRPPSPPAPESPAASPSPARRSPAPSAA